VSPCLGLARAGTVGRAQCSTTTALGLTTAKEGLHRMVAVKRTITQRCFRYSIACDG
jgi:hypothetical protein